MKKSLIDTIKVNYGRIQPAYKEFNLVFSGIDDTMYSLTHSHDKNTLVRKLTGEDSKRLAGVMLRGLIGESLFGSGVDEKNGFKFYSNKQDDTSRINIDDVIVDITDRNIQIIMDLSSDDKKVIAEYLRDIASRLEK